MKEDISGLTAYRAYRDKVNARTVKINWCIFLVCFLLWIWSIN